MRALRIKPISTAAMLIALLFGTTFMATLVMLGFMRLASEQALLGQEQALVFELRDDLLGEYEGDGRKALTEAIEDRLRYAGNGTPIILYTDPVGKRIAGNLRQWPMGLNVSARWSERELQRTGTDTPALAGFTVVRLGDGSRLLVGHVVEGAEQLRSAGRRGLTLALLVAFPLSLGVAFALTKIIERRISRIAVAAERVATGELSHRVPIDASGDAFDRLAQALNLMLDRIETLVAQLRLMTDGLAHDLRLPATRLKAVIERAVVETHDPASLAALEAASGEADKLLTMLTTALQISRTEAGIGSERLEPIKIDKLIEDLTQILGPVAEDAGFALEWSAPPNLVWPLHRELIGQALVNLIENALLHAQGDHIAVTAREQGSSLVLTVADNGVGIAKENHEKALSRFGRLDPSRHAEGAGLGLALASAAARLHGGSITLGDYAPGLIVRIELPRHE